MEFGEPWDQPQVRNRSDNFKTQSLKIAKMHRAKRRLTNSEDNEALDTLAACDREGRLPGCVVCSAEEAIESIRQQEEDNQGVDE